MKSTSVFVCSLLFCIHSFAQQFSVSFPDSLLSTPFTGSILVYLSKTSKEPRQASSLLDNAPCVRINVENINPGESVLIQASALTFPVPLPDLERGEYYVQVVWDRNLGGQFIGQSPGNLYSTSRKIRLRYQSQETFSIQADHIIPAYTFTETDYIKELKVPSKLLSDFHQTPYSLNAAIRLPKEYYTSPKRKFPVKFVVFGFTGNYHYFSGYPNPMEPIDTIPCIGVYLDGNCPLGHSVYANSDNNGPWADALIKEFIPQLEKTYRCNGARFLHGHSSGGWSVLWLQTQYPDQFTACWSSSPDPVDFHSFQKIDLYAHENMYFDKDSTLRPLGTIAGQVPWIYMRNAYQMETVIYRGEQMHSFDAVFGPKGPDGSPLRLVEPYKGEIDTAVFNHWKKYDISAYLVKNWEQVKNKLDGKIRITVGNQDNFLLNYPIRMMEKKMKELKAGIEFVYYPGDHFTVQTPQWVKEGNLFFEGKYLEWLKKK
ncbi:alpha/beta hydrolase-fold protein [Chitinophaga sp. LS1]|uniref:alpha/beta hydrolase-fold protein n=1 Tax=Chitinophaga sp. LS1 TaxID=3051176 RepID=UPI002AAB5123|nr:alpha/beta hydrolase-fold protein [Chitinophaga sp. LS1]WPV65894.1 alpha/beta hydrolase-fold protein [Chitinophaga sp. LS1]